MGQGRRYTVLLEPDEDGWIIATVPALPGCVTQGRTREEALANAREAIEGFIETLEAHHEPVPEEDAQVLEIAG
jgi:antitoxin HicB